MRNFWTEGQFSGLDLNEDLPSNEDIIGDLPGEIDTAASVSSSKVDETIQADPVSSNEEARQSATEKLEAEKSGEPSPSPSEQSKCSTHMEVLET